MKDYIINHFPSNKMVFIPFYPSQDRPSKDALGVSSDELRVLINKHHLSLEYRECFEFVIDLGVTGVNYLISHVVEDGKYIFTGPADYENWDQDSLARILRSKCYSVMLDFWVGHNKVSVCSRSGTHTSAFIINGAVANHITTESKQFIIDYCRISYLYPTLVKSPPKSAQDNLAILGLHYCPKSAQKK